ncbi:MAG: hypothetical protein K2Y37_03855 [Pirellulales bacterium]|nr:hypothetical protein [Pirellulales bacterium]
MASAANRNLPGSLPAEVTALLVALRRRVRRYLWTAGLAALLAAAAAAFWVSLALDWFFEMPAALRLLAVLAAAGAIGWVAFEFLWRRALVSLSDRSLALVLERQFPGFGDRLLTIVDPAVRPDAEAAPYAVELLRATAADTALAARHVDLDRVFNPWPLVRSVLVGTALAVSVAALVVVHPAIAHIWMRRALLLQSDLYPRRTRLAIDGFADGRAKVARGSSFNIVVMAATSHEVPTTVQVTYRAADGSRRRRYMTQEGRAERGRDPFQRFTYTFEQVDESLRFDVIGGDDRIRNLRLDVVEVPTIDVAQTVLDCEFPPYTGRVSRALPVTGVVQLPRGTRVRVRATATKPLVEARVAGIGEAETAPIAGGDSAHKPAAEGTSKAPPESATSAPCVIAPTADDPRRLVFDAGTLDANQTVIVTLHDTDGIESREPWRLVLAVVPDEVPLVNVRLRGIGPAITPQPRLPLVGDVHDDYALERVWWAYGITADKLAERDTARPAPGQGDLTVDDALDAKELALEPGQTLLVEVRARDNCALAGGPNIGVSDRFSLEVVTPDRLRAMLEARELNLRRRYEQLIEEVTGTRDGLARLELVTEPATSPTAERKSPAEGAAPAADDAAPATRPASGEEQLSANKLRVERAMQNSRKNADETAGVAASFEDLHDELVNNRIDTPELKSRLKEGIADPLRVVATVQFPLLDERLTALIAALGDPASGPPALLAAQQQLDVILVEMQQVLAKMMEIETFNEVVDQLRAIIEAQQKLNERTKDARRRKVRDLLED